MKNIVFGGCIALAIGTAAGAQGKNMMAADQGGHMAAAQTYSGCLERTDDGMFVLTHITAPKGNSGKASHAMKDNAMKDDSMKAEPMMEPAMSPDKLHLSSTSMDIGANAGRRVSVTGTADDMNGMAGLTVTSLKVLAKACR